MVVRSQVLPLPGKAGTFFLVVSGVVMCALVVAATAWIIWQMRETVIISAGADLRNVSRAAAGQVDRTLETLELAQEKIIASMEIPADGDISDLRSPAVGKPLHNIMQVLASSTAEAYSFAVIGPDGDVLLSSVLWPSTVTDVRDRDYFKVARSHPEVTDSESDVLSGKVTGQPIFALTHTLRKSDGSFGGMIVSYLKVSYLEKLFSTNTLQQSFTTSLVRSDGAILAHDPPLAISRDPERDSRFLAMITAAGSRPFIHKGMFTDVDRLFAVTKVSRRSFTVVVSQPLKQAIAPWYGQALAAFLLGLTGCLSTVATVTLAIYRGKLQQKVQSVEFYELITEQHTRYGVALDNMNQALLMYDQNNRLMLSNAAAASIFGLNADELRVGMTAVQVLARVSRKEWVSESDEEFKFFTRLIGETQRASFSHEMPDGRSITGHFVPLKTGWLLTFEDNTEVHRTNERIKQMALHDALTGLPNRTYFWNRMDNALGNMPAHASVAVLCLDLDDFKGVNDTLGHFTGDKLLCLVCERIAAEIGAASIVARLGGDEFAILVNPVQSMSSLTDLADRLIMSIREPYAVDGHMLCVGLSIGIALAPSDGLETETLMKKADMALYAAKRGGRGKYEVFDSSMLQRAFERRRMENELQKAVTNHEFELFYQPIVSVQTRAIVSFEALIRWRHPSGELVSPQKFIPVAEENGLIVEIGGWALRRACLQAASWSRDVRVAVNLSSVQFRGGTLIGIVRDALTVSGLAPERLELEITESAMMRDTAATLATLRALKKLGLRIAMDDFGTGYSSLAYIQRFPFDKVKIDRAFVRDIKSAGSKAIVRAVTGIASSLGIHTLAEGVETEDQFRIIVSEGCTEAQGFLFGVPRLASQVEEFFAAERRRDGTTDRTRVSHG